MADIKKVVLAYSGGLDTSFLVPWLKENYGRPIITVTVDTGGIDAATKETLRSRALALGASEHHQIDARADYFEQVLRFLVMGNVRRGQLYPLCVGAERVMQAQTIARMARELGTGSIAHGCTAAGNDQVRFEVALRTLAPELDQEEAVRLFISCNDHDNLLLFSDRGVVHTVPAYDRHRRLSFLKRLNQVQREDREPGAFVFTRDTAAQT